MNHIRAVIPALVGFVVVTAVAFGPLVSGLSLASEPETDISGEGVLRIGSVEFPNNATIESASYGATNAYLSTPPATVRFESIRNNPILIYQISVPDLGYTMSTTHFLNADDHGPTYEAALDPLSVSTSRVTKQQYTGELAIVVRDSDGRRVVARQNITVEVAE